MNYAALQCNRLVAFALLMTVAAATPAVGNHTHGQFRVTVQPDPLSVMSASDYQILVENEELLLSRLTAPYEGTLSRSFVADLDRDGAFEVVVTFSRPDGETGEAHVYRWADNLLQRVQLAALEEDQLAGYRGNDEFVVSDNKLLRMFQIHASDGEPTSAVRRLRYSFSEGRWTSD